jgi:hypothetical protein
MQFLNNIDWQGDDGVNRAMINDFMRNQFYDAVLRDHVRDQHCVDIGFGTGLLSVLALKHGARSVLAYETNVHRFQLGQFIIQNLGLQDRVTLKHSSYTFQEQIAGSVLFSETVNGGLWGESLWQSLPRTKDVEFLPGRYWCEIMAAAVPNSFVNDIVLGSEDSDCFAPGVDIDAEFVRLINMIGFQKNVAVPNLPPSGIHRLGTGVPTVHGRIPWQRIAMHTARCVARYEIDVNAQTLTVEDADGVQELPIDWDADSFSITVDTEPYQQQNLLLVPRMGLAHNQHCLTLDTGHWGPAEIPVLAVRPAANITITHSITDGGLIYNYKQ